MSQKANNTTAFLAALYLTEPEFCRELFITPRTAKRWNARGIGPARTKIGGRIFYSKRSVLAWLKKHEQRRAA